MSKKIVVIGIFLSLIAFNINAQGCDSLVPSQTPSAACSGTVFNFNLTNASGSAIWGEYNWYIQGTSGFQLVSTGSNNSYQTGSLTESKMFRAVVNLDGCTAQTHDFYATIIPPPSVPVPNHVAVCGQGSMTLSVNYTSNYNYEWFEVGTNIKLTPGITGLLSSGQSYMLSGAGYSQLIIDQTAQSLNFIVQATDLSNPGCGYSSTQVNGIVNPLPTVSAGPSQNICLTGSTVSLSGSPSGGTWSGPGVSGTTFSPANAGAGTHMLYYSYTNPVTGCSSIANTTMIVGPAVSIPAMTTCNSTIVFPLSASPAGGTWSGSYVDAASATFNAHTAGTGIHSLSYTYNLSGCIVTKTSTIVVTNSPWSIPYEVRSTSVCGSGSVRLSVDNLGNTSEEIEDYMWFDENDAPLVINGQFARGLTFDTPNLTSVKVYRVRGINTAGCQSSPSNVTADIQAMPVPPQVVPGYNCSNGTGIISVTAIAGLNYIWRDPDGVVIDPMTTGGTITYQFSGTGNSSVSVSGIPGTSNFAFSVEAYNPQQQACGSSSASPATIYYRPLPVITIPLNVPSSICLTNPSFTLSGGLPAGGNWEIDSAPATAINPALLGNGSHALKYSFTDSYGCFNKAEKPILVRDLTKPGAGYLLIDYGTKATLNVTGAASTESYRWYSNTGALLHEGEGYTTSDLISTTDFHVTKYEVNNSLCESAEYSLFRVATRPANNYNYVREEVVSVSNIREASEVIGLNKNQKVSKTTYFEGLGRPSQITSQQLSPAGHDVVEPIVYDQAGRESIKYLPFVSEQTNGWFKKNSTGVAQYEGSVQHQFYDGTQLTIAQDAKPYAQVQFEASPLNRVVKQGAPGEAWQPGATSAGSTDHTVKKNYLLNKVQDSIYSFRYDFDTNTITWNALPYYDVDELQAIVTSDEKDMRVIEFTDKDGRTICKKVQSGGTPQAPVFAETYYLYDDFGNLIVVLPPEGVAKLKANLN